MRKCHQKQVKEKIISIKNKKINTDNKTLKKSVKNKEENCNKNDKIRIYEIAKELGITSKEVLEIANNLKINAKSAQSIILLYEAEKIVNKVFGIEEPEKNKTNETKNLNNKININQVNEADYSSIDYKPTEVAIQVSKEISKKFIENDVVSPSFVEEQPLITKSGIKIKSKKNNKNDKIKKTILYKNKLLKTAFTKNEIIIEKNEETGEYKKTLFKIKGKKVPYIFEELVEQNLIKKFIDYKACTRKESYLIQALLMNQDIDIKTVVDFIEKSKNKKYILIFLKVFNIEKYNLVLNNSKKLHKKDYRRSVSSICKFYNKYGLFFKN